MAETIVPARAPSPAPGEAPSRAPARPPARPARRGAPWGRRFLRVELGLLLAFLYLPIAVVVVLSFNKSGQPTAWGGFSLTWYETVLGNEKLLSAFGNTLVVGVATTIVATILGTLLALGLERAIKSSFLDAFVYVPMIIPDIVFAIALLSFYNLVFSGLLKLQLGLWSVVLSHVTFDIAFVAIVVRTRLRHFDRSIEEASLDLGANPLRTFWNVTLPAIMPGIVAGGLIAFTLSFDEFIIAFFTKGTVETFPTQVYSMIRFGVTPEVNVIATVVLVFSITLVLASQRLRGGIE
jgi:spermidine/putrescine transport system permease protein